MWPRGDVGGDAGLGGGDGAIANGAVAGDADLAGEDDVATDGSGAGEADLRAEEGVFAHSGSVAYLDKIIDFGSAADAGFTDGGAVNAGVGLDFDVVFKDGRSGLEDLVPGRGFAGFGEAEAVGADDGTVLEGHVVPEDAVLTGRWRGRGRGSGGRCGRGGIGRRAGEGWRRHLG